MREELFIYWLVPLLTGWLLDKMLGDPHFLPHPIVWFGKSIAWAEKKFNKNKHKVLKGAFVSLFFPLFVFISLLSINILLFIHCFWLGLIFNTLGVFFALSGKTLAKEVQNVFKATDVSIEKGRKQVARIVGRNTSQLSENQIKIASLETLSENLSDGVIAPLFWYGIGGVPAMLAYKMTNTLDSMIGYKSERYKDFGRWSAKVDDIANYLPARLTTLLMILVSGKWEVFGFVKRYAKNHSSPNAGFPESALAGILDCRFGGGNYYFGTFVEKPYIGTTDRKLTKKDLDKALKINIWSEILMLIMMTIGIVTLRYFMK